LFEVPSRRPFWHRMHDEGSTSRSRLRDRYVVCPAQGSPISLFGSNS
jgi:hypothetical protein